MDEKVLKKVIKQYVREALTEIFAEMKLETIVEKVVSKSVPTQRSAPAAAAPVQPKLSVREAVMGAQEQVPVQTKQSLSSAEKRRIIAERLGGDDMWKDIYADTATSSNPILNDDKPAEQEEVPAHVLESMGLMKDYSKHIGMDKKTVEDDSEWQKKREERAKILSKIKRM